MKSTHYQSLKNEYKDKVDGLCRKAAEEVRLEFFPKMVFF